MSSNFSGPITALQTRLAEHIGLGGPLAGFKLVTQPRTEQETVDSFPTIRVQGLAIEEAGNPPRSATSAKVTVALEIAVERKAASAVARLADAIAAVCDALETNTDGAPEPGADASTPNGLEFKTEGSGVSGLALFTVLTVTFTTKPALRGGRVSA